MATRKRSSRPETSEIPISVKPGEILEHRLMRLFARQRYFVRRGILIHTESFLNQATDLDVIAVRWIPPLTRHVQIIECKSGKEGPLDRIFWLSGVQKYVGADSATLVRPNTKWDIKAFARELGVQLLDLASLGALEERLLLGDEWPGNADYDFVNANRQDWISALNADAQSAGLYSFLQGETKWGREIASLRFLLFHLRRLTKQLASDKPAAASLHSVLIADALGQFCMFALSFASRALEMRSADVQALIYRDSKYGNSDKRVVERFMRLSYRIAEEALSTAGVSPERLERQDFDLPEPSNTEEIFRIVESILAHVGTSEDLAAFVDFVAQERFVRGRDGSDWIERTYGSSVGVLSQLAGRICGILEGLDALPRGFSDIFAIGKKTKADDAKVTARDTVVFEPIRTIVEDRVEDESADDSLAQDTLFPT